jgi:hypothetical protein
MPLTLSTDALGENFLQRGPGPRVHFDDYVSVLIVFPIEAYPSDIRSLWMSRAEVDACMQSAMKEHALRRTYVQRKCVNPISRPRKPPVSLMMFHSFLKLRNKAIVPLSFSLAPPYRNDTTSAFP